MLLPSLVLLPVATRKAILLTGSIGPAPEKLTTIPEEVPVQHAMMASVSSQLPSWVVEMLDRQGVLCWDSLQYIAVITFNRVLTLAHVDMRACKTFINVSMAHAL